MKLSRGTSQILVIDIQERLTPAMAEGQASVDNAAKLLRCAARLDVPTTITEQYRRGIGPTLPVILEAAGPQSAVFEKMSFSALQDEAIAAHVKQCALHSGRPQVVVTGIESHVCVLQTALDLVEAGLQAFVVVDAVTSRALSSKEAALQRLTANGVELVTTEMVIFEWLERAGTDDFRALLPLIK